LAANPYYYGTGRRKTAVARVFLAPGTGKVTVNDKPLEDFFPMKPFQMTLSQPFKVTETMGKYDAKVSVLGGGITGQVEAIRHGISRALLEVDEEYRLPLKKAGLLTRDPRMKERKKPGLKKARKAPQFSKR